jgi:hypothetical protein
MILPNSGPRLFIVRTFPDSLIILLYVGYKYTVRRTTAASVHDPRHELPSNIWAGYSIQLNPGNSTCTAADPFRCSGADVRVSYAEIPLNCVGGIRELFYCRLIASLLLALLLNTSRSYTLLRIICLVSTVVTHS